MDADSLQLNAAAHQLLEQWLPSAGRHNSRVHRIADALVLDAGVECVGSLAAGRLLADLCLSGQGVVTVSLDRCAGQPSGSVSVELSEPWIGCLLSQYAGLKVQVGKYFAMCSGPMRLVRPREELVHELGYSESPDYAVGVLEAGRLPTEEVIEHLSERLGMPTNRLLLAVAPTASIAGSIQIVARSVEACLHKLHHLGYPVKHVRSGLGRAPLPPIPKDDLTAIGWVNDAILYGAEVLLWCDGPSEALTAVGGKIPAQASHDYGDPFQTIFERYKGDFYAIDPLLFSPALVTLNHLSTGTRATFGQVNDAVLERSFYGGDPAGASG